MKERTDTFRTAANASDVQQRSGAQSFAAPAGRLRRHARFAGVLLLGCLLLLSLFALQIAALELSDRLDIFPLYGLFFINSLAALCLTGLIFISRKSSLRLTPYAVPKASVLLNRLSGYRASLSRAPKLQKVEAQIPERPKALAVLLIIKRHASKESKAGGRAAST
jgi:hypothetical protein